DTADASVPVEQNPFLTSRRRHTMSLRDWSSDVCSSDLVITVANTGNVTLTGVSVTDPFADPGSIVRGADVVGDNDALLEVGETWGFTAAHTVTQAEIDTNGRSEERRVGKATGHSNESADDSDDGRVPGGQYMALK